MISNTIIVPTRGVVVVSWQAFGQVAIAIGGARPPAITAAIWRKSASLKSYRVRITNPVNDNVRDKSRTPGSHRALGQELGSGWKATERTARRHPS